MSSGADASSVFRVDGRVAVVTGALGKLGPVWCEALLEAGATVAALDLAEAKPTARYQSLDARFGGKRLHRVVADVRDRASLERARQAVRNAAGPVGILVNNAGIDAPPAAGSTPATVAAVSYEASLRVLEVNALGAFQVAQVFADDMLAAHKGSIVNIGSLYASVAPDARFYDHLEPPFLKPPAYGASKAAVVNLTKYLATAWGPQGVRVNALSPGGVQAGQDGSFQRKFVERVPLGRMAHESDLGGPLLFLASDASAYVTGIELRVDGGYTAW